MTRPRWADIASAVHVLLPLTAAGLRQGFSARGDEGMTGEPGHDPSFDELLDHPASTRLAHSLEALVKTDPDVANNTLIFPTPEILANAHVFRGLSADEETRYNKAFQQLIAT
jgi:hypothetical protein